MRSNYSKSSIDAKNHRNTYNNFQFCTHITKHLTQIIKHRTHIISYMYIVLNTRSKNYIYTHIRVKGRDLTQSYDKSPYTYRKLQKSRVPTQQRNLKFDYKTTADRLRKVSWSDYSHPTVVVKQVYGIHTFPLTAKVV